MDAKDRELLELAAKAAGKIPEEFKGNKNFLNGILDVWNPLTDDGHAMKLAVKLDISLRLNGDELCGIAHWYQKGKLCRVVGNYQTGKTKDARRLIVLAAAEIGRTTQ